MKVKLLKPLTIAGKDHAADEIVDVSSETASWLADPVRKVIAPPATTPTSTGKSGRTEIIHD